MTDGDEASHLREQLRAALAENEKLKRKAVNLAAGLRCIARRPIIHEDNPRLTEAREIARRALDEAGEERYA